MLESQFRYLHTQPFFTELSREFLLSRLDVMTISPSNIFDICCHGSVNNSLLTNQFTNANYLYVPEYICRAYVGSSKTKSIREMLTLSSIFGFLNIPVKEDAIDLIFSNCFLHYVCDRVNILNQFNNILSNDGLLLLSCFGKNTSPFIAQVLPISMPDLMTLGNEFVQAGFVAPVIERECLNISYKSQFQFIEDLKAIAIGDDKINFDQFNLPKAPFSIEIELFIAHAFKERNRPQKEVAIHFFE